MDEESEGNIDDLFERLKDSGSEQEKAELAESCLDLFYELSYDFSCNKFNDAEYLYSLVENIELLKGTISWSLRAQVYSMLMDQAETNEDSAAVMRNGHLAIEALYNQLTEGEETKQFIYQNLTHYYYTLLNYLSDNAVEYWKKSLYYSKETILENAMSGSWIMYFTLLYSTSKQESDLLAELRTSEVNAFRNWSFSLNQDGLAYIIASQFIRFKTLTEDNESVNYSFPEKEYFFWLEKSLLDEITDLGAMETSNAGHFYKKEGIRLQRIDLLERALIYFEKVFYDYPSHGGFCIYYITDVLENIARIYKNYGLTEKAAALITKALEWNEEHYETIETNYSLLSHYAEFLVRCYDYRDDVQIPSLDFILSIIKQTEIKGDGLLQWLLFSPGTNCADSKK